MLGAVASVILRLPPHGVIGPRDEDPSSSRQASIPSKLYVNVSVASSFLRGGGANSLNPPPFSFGLGTAAKAELTWQRTERVISICG